MPLNYTVFVAVKTTADFLRLDTGHEGTAVAGRGSPFPPCTVAAVRHRSSWFREPVAKAVVRVIRPQGLDESVLSALSAIRWLVALLIW